MFTLRRITTVLATAAAIVVPAAAAQAQAPDAAMEWTVENNYDTGTVKNDREYKLNNRGSRVGYENRTFGVDMGWTSGGGNWVFRHNTGSSNVRDHRSYPLTETENVSIYNTKKKAYLRFHERGIWKAELEWDKNPQYQWQLRRQTASGTSVKFGLFNDKVDKFLVHQVKNYGINLGWLEQGPQVAQNFSVPLSAQPVVQGWVPYLGSFGGGVKGKLLDVQNASQSATLLFLKPGKSSAQCGDPTATIPVPPRERLKPDQLQTLYGSSTPALPVNFLACLTTPTPQSISLTFLNISYRLDG
jgi:hypothetical protein